MSLKVGDLIPIGGSGNAKSEDVLSGKTYSSDEGVDLVGTMPNNGEINYVLPINGSYTILKGYTSGGKITQSIPTKGAATYTPGTTDQTIAAGQYLSGNQVIKGDANLVASNIKSGVSIFGILGSLVPLTNERKWASGTTTVTDSLRLTVNGLPFTPKIIVAKSTYLSNGIAAYFVDWQKGIVPGAGGSYVDYYDLCTFSSDGFSVLVGYNPSGNIYGTYTIDWIAIG